MDWRAAFSATLGLIACVMFVGFLVLMGWTVSVWTWKAMLAWLVSFGCVWIWLGGYFEAKRQRDRSNARAALGHKDRGGE